MTVISAIRKPHCASQSYLECYRSRFARRDSRGEQNTSATLLSLDCGTQMYYPRQWIFACFIVILFWEVTNASQICIPPSRFLAPTSTDFKSCYDKIQNMSTVERFESHCFTDSPAEGILTLAGCKVMCGGGSDFWEWKDTFGRLSLLVFPTIVLIAYLCFPPLGMNAYPVLAVQAIGNPIGSISSLLTRFTIHRSYRRLAQSGRMFDVPSNVAQSERQKVLAKSLATVFSAYEELGWQDLYRFWKWPLSLTNEEQRVIMKASYELSSSRLKSHFPAMIAIGTLVWSLVTAVIRTIKQTDPVNSRVYNETAHTIAVVSILFVTIPQVWFGARIGTFTTDAGAVHILESMITELEDIDTAAGATKIRLPPPQLAICDGHTTILSHESSAAHKIEKFFSQCPLEDAVPSMSSCEPTWRGYKGHFTGVSSTWSGCSHRPRANNSPGHFQLTTLSCLFIIFGAGVPAYALSGTNNSVKKPLNIGCRSLSWISIMVLWMLSFAFDRIIRASVCHLYGNQAPIDKLKKVWWCSVVKDTAITLGVITLVLLVEIGTYNSCECRSSFRGIVNLMGYSQKDWARAQLLWSIIPSVGLTINVVLILWVELAYWGTGGRFSRLSRWQGGTLLCKSQEETEAEWREIQALGRGRSGDEIAESCDDDSQHGVELQSLGMRPLTMENEEARPMLEETDLENDRYVR